MLGLLSADNALDLLRLVASPGVPPLPALLRAAQRAAAHCVYRGLGCAPEVSGLMQDMLRSDQGPENVAVSGFFNELVAAQAEFCDFAADERYCDALAREAAEFIDHTIDHSLEREIETYSESRDFADGVSVMVERNFDVRRYKHVITVAAPTDVLKMRLVEAIEL